jgi:ribosomal-protein-alanine N-acetyltransferase
MLLRYGHPADLPGLLHLERCFPTDRLAERDFRCSLADPHSAVLVASLGEDLVGYAIGQLRPRSGSMRIFSLATDPERRRTGLGRALVAAMEQEARKRGVRSLHLEVRQGDAGARAFYRLLGFSTCGSVRNYYGDGETAAGMRKHLS